MQPERARGPAARGAGPVRAMIAAAVVGPAVLLAGLIWASERDVHPPADRSDVLRVGVVQGQSVPGYLRSSRTELAALTSPSAPVTGDTWALVSLGRYLPPGALPKLLSGAEVAEIYTRVPLAGAHTQVVRIRVHRLPADAMSGMLDAAVDRERERAEYLKLGHRVRNQGEPQERARRAYETAAGIAGTEAAAYRSGCSCVFAAVVRAAPAALQGLARRPGVRVVDPAPEVDRLDRTEFRPPLPEQTGTVPAEPSREPAVPNEDSGIASHASAPIMSSFGVPVRSISAGSADNDPISSDPAPEEGTAIPSPPNATAARQLSGTSSAAP